DIVRRIGLWQIRHRSVSSRNKSPLVQRTNGSWYHLLVRRRGGPLIAVRRCPGALATRYRAFPVTTRERPSRRRARAARTIPHSLRGRPVATLPGHRREGGSVARALWLPCLRSRTRAAGLIGR